MSNSNEQKSVVDEEENREEEQVSETVPEMELKTNPGLVKALDIYRKLMEGKEELPEKEQAELEKKLKEIEKREIIERDSFHEPVEIPAEKGKITVGPPTLTRFEKARITGTRSCRSGTNCRP